MKDIKIILCSTCGTYHSWLQWTVASVYNSVDDIVVVNSGYDTDKPEEGCNKPLIRELNQLKLLDIDKKIIQVSSGFDLLKRIGLLDKDNDEAARSGNITYSFQYAYSLAEKKGYDLNNTWILKADSDQIFDESFTREKLEELVNNSAGYSGFRFGQYADFFREFDKVQSLPDWSENKVGDMSNDGAYFFRINKNARTGGQGSPANIEQFPIPDMRTFHMRRISCPDVNEYDYFYKRFWYHTFGPNQIMQHGYNRETGKKLTNEEIDIEAKKQTESLLNSKGFDKYHFMNKDELDERFPPGEPLVCKIGQKVYIKQGYPK